MNIHLVCFSAHSLNELINQLPQLFVMSSSIAVPHISSLMATKAKLIPAKLLQEKDLETALAAPLATQRVHDVTGQAHESG